MITVIGIGQILRGDDGVGLAAVSFWRESYISASQDCNIRVELAENPGIGLLNLLEGADSAILVDAVQSGAKPGTLHCLVESDIAAFASGSGSVHGWGVAETLALGWKIDPTSLPERIILIGIEAEQVDLGAGLSLDVAAVLPDAARLIQNTIELLGSK